VSRGIHGCSPESITPANDAADEHVVRVPERFRAEICAFGDERLPVLSHAVIDRETDYTGATDTGQASA
jgi:hypothetical protein